MRKNISQIHHLHATGPLGFGIVTYRPGGNLGMRTQENVQLVVIHRGELHLRIDAAEVHVPAGHGILLEPGHRETFQFSTRQETTHTWCQYPREMSPGPLVAPPVAAMGVPAPCSPWLLGTMRAGWRLPAPGGSAEDVRIRLAAVLTAMAEFVRPILHAQAEVRARHGPRERATAGAPGSVAARPPGITPPPLARLSAALMEKLDHPWTLDELARAAGVSRGHLIKLSREYWAATPMEKLWRTRVDHAALLLRDTGLSIGEVAYRTGFANPFHFSRRFSQAYGRNPRAWRAAAWGN